MNPEIKQLWTGALRSETYKQEKGHLRVGDGFCCLGVLCDLYEKQTPGAMWNEQRSDDSVRPFTSPSGERSEAALPYAVQQWAGLEDSNPDVYTEAGRLSMSSLANLNDSGSTFREIADLIEKSL